MKFMNGSQYPEFKAVISNTKHKVLRLYNPTTRQDIKYKYINLLSQQKDLYQQFLYRLNRNITNQQLQFIISYEFFQNKENNEQYFLVIQDIFINHSNLTNRSLNNFNKRLSDELDLSNGQVIFKLLDVFMANLNAISLIINEQNLFIQTEEFKVNSISFVGVDLLVFNKPITKNQFKAIYAYLDSQIFERMPMQRLNSTLKIKNYAVLLLRLALNLPLNLLEVQKLPDYIDAEVAANLLKKLKGKYEKILKNKTIIEKLKSKSKLWKFNLQQFFQIVLVEQRKVSWCQIKNMLHKPTYQPKFQRIVYNIGYNCWKQLSGYEKMYWENLNIISLNEQDNLIKFELFVTLLLGEKVSSMRKGSLIEELAHNKQFNQITYRMVKDIIKIFNNNSECLEKPYEQTKEHHFYDILAKAISFTPFKTYHYVTCKYSDLAEQQLAQSEETIINGNDTDRTLQLANEERSQQDSYQQDNTQSNKNMIETIKDQSQKYEEIASLMKSKMTYQIKAHSKYYCIEHERVTGIRKYQALLKLF